VIDFPQVVAGDSIAVSATLFMTYARCPDQALGRLRGFYPEESRASFKGGLAHRMFARHLGSGPIGEGDFDRVCKQEIGTALNPKLGALGMKPSQLTSVIKEVGDLYQRFKELSVAGFRVAECFVETEPSAGVMLRGSIDAVFDDDDGVRLVDWKTGGLYETEQQLSFYALLWSLDRHELPARVEAVSIGSGERLTAEPTLDSIAETAAAVATLVNEMRTSLAAGEDGLARVGGPWCRYCPQLDVCEEGAAAVRVADS
jgi:hypothetical protein